MQMRFMAAFLAAILSIQMTAMPVLAGEMLAGEPASSEWVEGENLEEDDLMPPAETPSALEGLVEAPAETPTEEATPSQEAAEVPEEKSAPSEEPNKGLVEEPTEEPNPIEMPAQIVALLLAGEKETVADDRLQLSFKPVEGAAGYQARVFLEEEGVASAEAYASLSNLREEMMDAKTIYVGELDNLDLQEDQNYRVELIALPAEGTQTESAPFVTYLRTANQPTVVVEAIQDAYALVWEGEEELSYQVVQQDGTPLAQEALAQIGETISTKVEELGTYFVQPYAEETIDGKAERRFGLTREVLVQAVSASAVPQKLTATAGDTKVQLSWDAVVGENVTYIVKKAEKGVAPQVWTDLTPVATNQLEDTAVINGTTYQYTVRAVVAGVESTESAAVEATPVGQAALVAPTLKVKASGFSLNFSWNDVGADQYFIYRDDKLIQTLDGKVLTYQEQPANTNQDYSYRVDAKRGEVATATGIAVTAKTSVKAPTGLKAKAGDAQVGLSWQKHAYAKSYVVKYGTKTVVTKTNSATIKGLTNSATHTFTVAACATTDGKGARSTAASVKEKPMVVRPETPKNFKVTPGNLKMNLSWSKVTGATQYEVWRYKTALKTYVKVATVTDARWTDTDIKTTSDYRYRVRAVRVSGGKAAASAYTNTLIYRGVKTVAKVTGVKATAGESRVTLTWNKVTNADGYYIYRYNAKTKKYEKINSTNGVTKYTNTNGVLNGTSYYYKVRAYEEVSQRVTSGSAKIKVLSEEYSATAKAIPQIIIPGKVGNVKASQTSKTKVEVRWSETKDATGYRVYRYNDKTRKYETLRDTTSLTVSDKKSIVLGKTYKYRVRAYRVVKDVRYYSSEYSATVSIKILEKSRDELLKEEALATVHAIYYNATVNQTSNKYTGHFGSTRVGTVSSGTKVQVLYRTENSRCKVQLPSGQIVYINRGNLNMNSNIYKANAYSDEIAEAFVNAKNYKSDTNYMVWLSTYSQRVFMFKKVNGRWALQRSSTCASGKMATPTPHGHHEVEYRDRRWSYGGGYHVNYPVTFTIPKSYPHGNAFHSRIYWNSGSLKDGTQSRPVSNGCPRLPDEAIKYIYNEVPNNSLVLSY